jgi:hypothetical protein
MLSVTTPNNTEAKNITNVYTCIWFYTPEDYQLKKFKYASSSFYTALTTLRNVEPLANDLAQSTIVTDTDYIKGSFCIEPIN